MNIYKLLLLAIAFAIPGLSQAQKWEFGIFGGTSHYNGDLSEGLFMPSAIHPAIGGILRYNINYKWSIRGGAYYGTISGDDANATDPRRVARNLSFQSQITELSIVPEFHFTGYKIRSKRYKFSPYAFAGLGIYKFNPYTTYNNQTYYLQPLRTEGQGSLYYQSIDQPREVYGLTQVSVPLGLGIKYMLGWNFTMSFEVTARKVFTDYLDDVSKTYVPRSVFTATTGDIAWQIHDRRSELTGEEVPPEDRVVPRGNPGNNDWYYFTGFTFTYTFFPPNCFKF